MDTESPENIPPKCQRCKGCERTQDEPFVKPDVVAEYLDIDAATVVRFAARRIIPGHPLRDSGKRSHWRFLLSEVRESMLAQKSLKHRNVRSPERRK